MGMPTEEIYLGKRVPIWWMSNKFSGTPNNRGNGTFSNVILISNKFGPTLDPTSSPTVEPTYNPTDDPTDDVFSEKEDDILFTTYLFIAVPLLICCILVICIIFICKSRKDNTIQTISVPMASPIKRIPNIHQQNKGNGERHRNSSNVKQPGTGELTDNEDDDENHPFDHNIKLEMDEFIVEAEDDDDDDDTDNVMTPKGNETEDGDGTDDDILYINNGDDIITKGNDDNDDYNDDIELNDNEFIVGNNGDDIITHGNYKDNDDDDDIELNDGEFIVDQDSEIDI